MHSAIRHILCRILDCIYLELSWGARLFISFSFLTDSDTAKRWPSHPNASRELYDKCSSADRKDHMPEFYLRKMADCDLSTDAGNKGQKRPLKRLGF